MYRVMLPILYCPVIGDVANRRWLMIALTIFVSDWFGRSANLAFRRGGWRRGRASGPISFFIRTVEACFHERPGRFPIAVAGNTQDPQRMSIEAAERDRRA